MKPSNMKTIIGAILVVAAVQTPTWAITEKFIGTYTIAKVVYQLEVNPETRELRPTTTVVMDEGSYITYLGVWEITRDIMAADFIVDLYMSDVGEIRMSAHIINVSDRLGEAQDDS